MSVKSSFEPIADKRTRVFILGSLPGERSLEQQRYYAHPTNQFWKLVGSLIGTDLHERDYADRLKTLRQHGIGLWDVVGAAEREGSGDQAIRNATHNDLGGLKADYPHLRAVGFNGGLAAKQGLRLLGSVSGLQLHALPSSSAANAGMTLAAKIQAWSVLRHYLQP